MKWDGSMFFYLADEPYIYLLRSVLQEALEGDFHRES